MTTRNKTYECKVRLASSEERDRLCEYLNEKGICHDRVDDDFVHLWEVPNRALNATIGWAIDQGMTLAATI